MKKYYSIDNNIKYSTIGIILCIIIPLYGPYLFGTRFTTMYSSEREAGRIIIVTSLITHIYLIINLPNPRNHPHTRSCYIGMKGKIEKLSEGWSLFTGTSYLILGDRFSYKFLYNYKLPSL